jgi:hypothetical protein
VVAGDEGGLEYDMSQQTPAATDSALAAVMCNGDLPRDFSSIWN